MDSALEVCPVCTKRTITWSHDGRPVRVEWRVEGTFEIWKCTSCSHQFINPLPNDEVLTRCYSSEYRPYTAGHGIEGVQEAKETAEREKRYRHVELNNELDVLDIGCGSGSFLAVIRDQVRSILGIEPSEHGFETCKTLDIPVFLGDMEAYSKAHDTKFDLITLNHVLEHHPAPLRLLDLCRQHLKPEGSIWLAVPNGGCYFARKLRSDWHSSDLPVHLQHFTVASLQQAIKQTGLHVRQIRTESENSLPSSAATLLRRFGLPARISRHVLKSSFAKEGWIGKRIDGSGNGEAILLSASH